MAKLINLLPELSAEQKEKDVRLWYLNLVAIVALLVVVLVLAGLFAFKSVTQSQLERNQTQISQREATIRSQSEIINLTTFIDSKVAKLSPNLIKREKRFNFGRLVDLLPVGVSLVNFQENAKNEFALNGTSSEIGPIQEFVDILKKDGQLYFSDFFIKAIVKDDKGLYGFSLLFTKKESQPDLNAQS